MAGQDSALQLLKRLKLYTLYQVKPGQYFWSTGKTTKKQGQSLDKIKIIFFDSLGQYLLKDIILHSKHRRKTLSVQFIIIMINASCFGLYVCFVLLLFSLKIRKQQISKKTNCPNFTILFFLFFIKVGRSGAQINKLTLTCLKYFH